LSNLFLAAGDVSYSKHSHLRRATRRVESNLHILALFSDLLKICCGNYSDFFLYLFLICISSQCTDLHDYYYLFRLHHTMKFSACGGVIYYKE